MLGRAGHGPARRETPPMFFTDHSWDAKRYWTRYSPDGRLPWDPRRVVHLHRRAGFAATWGEIQRDLKDGPDAAIDRLLKGRTRTEAVPEDFAAIADALGSQAVESSDATRLKAWWLYRMVWTPDPLGERLTLLWH